MPELKQRLKELVERLNLNRDTVVRFLVFTLFAGLMFLTLIFYSHALTTFENALLLAAPAILLLVTLIMAGHAVIKSLFLVGASLSLVIYLAQTYCEVPVSSRTGASDEALKFVLIFSLAYIGFDFLRVLIKETKERSKTLKEIKKRKEALVYSGSIRTIHRLVCGTNLSCVIANIQESLRLQVA